MNRDRTGDGRWRTPAGRLLQGKAWPRPGHVLAVEAAAQWGAVASAAGQQGHRAERRQPWWLRSRGAGGGESEPGGGEG